MDALIAALKGVAEPTRLRIVALCGRAELSVSELVDVLGQSQPRVSRHLKTLVEAGLLQRHQEGSWAFYRLADRGPGAVLGRAALDMVPADDETVQRDRERLDRILERRRAAAERYFAENAAQWDEMRSLYVEEAEVEAAIRALVPDAVGEHVDIGTGTGRLLTGLQDLVGRSVGVDMSRAMLAVARVNLEKAGAERCQVRLGDMYQLPLPRQSADLVTLHQVLHYAEAPAQAIAEAARVLRPGGRLLVIDFAKHDLEALRRDHAHRRLGFSDDSVRLWCEEAGLVPVDTRYLPGDPLTVTIWAADRPAAADPDTVAGHLTPVAIDTARATGEERRTSA